MNAAICHGFSGLSQKLIGHYNSSSHVLSQSWACHPVGKGEYFHINWQNATYLKSGFGLKSICRFLYNSKDAKNQKASGKGLNYYHFCTYDFFFWSLHYLKQYLAPLFPL